MKIRLTCTAPNALKRSSIFQVIQPGRIGENALLDLYVSMKQHGGANSGHVLYVKYGEGIIPATIKKKKTELQ